MFPSAYEFHWDLGHIVFLGIFYGVVITVCTGLGCAAFHWLQDLRRRRVSSIEWEETFHDLPAERRHCRHEFDGTFSHRICDHGFDCGTCARQRELTGAHPASAGGQEDRLHHRGHTWIEPGPHGTVTVGLDDFSRGCFGRPDRVRLPACGQDLAAGERAVTLQRGSLMARLSAPVSGTVVAQGSFDEGWLYRLVPSGPGDEFQNLLHGAEAENWLLREREWLQHALSPAGTTPVLTDGGTITGDLVQAYPQADWDDIWGQVCLEV
jgi:glycine cleavage system H lipoate-binding protein